MTIHILGTGAIGCHVASVLKRNNRNVTLLLRSKDHLTEFNNKNNTITYRREGKANLISGFQANDVMRHTDPITSLIVATKTQHTMDAVASVAPYLSSSSTILLLQNGMGVADKLINEFWLKREMPSLLVGVNRHAVVRMDPYDVNHVSGFNSLEGLIVGQYPGSPVSKSGLAETIVQIPEFRAQLLPWDQVHMKIVKKLIINACLNSVSGVLDCKNKVALNPYGQILLKSICDEAFQVFKNDLPGESLESIINMVNQVAKETGENTSSTLQDIRNRRLTEIDYFNGYICKLGKERNIDTRTNEQMVNLIHAKEAMYGVQ